MGKGLLHQLEAILGAENVLPGEPLSRHTTLRLGGPADVFLHIPQASTLRPVLALAREAGVPISILGKGSNVLVLDDGVRGWVLHLGDGLAPMKGPLPLPDGRMSLEVEAGLGLPKLAAAAGAYGLEGLAFAAGIPGTVGGALCMNAGAYGGEMKDVVTSVIAVDFQGKETRYPAEALTLGYRSSRFTDSTNPPAILTAVTLALTPGSPAHIQAQMRDFAARRREKQPLSLPSCGSTFKRPQGHFAGALIEQCGLKGYRIGGASVSTLHGGFLLNDGEGTGADYLALMRHVQRVVQQKTGVLLEPEVRIWGSKEPTAPEGL